MCYQITQTSYTIKDVGHNKNSFKFKITYYEIDFFPFVSSTEWILTCLFTNTSSMLSPSQQALHAR
jgi:hypothetical protein